MVNCKCSFTELTPVSIGKYLLHFSTDQILISLAELVMYHGQVKYQGRGADTHPRGTGQEHSQRT